MSLWTCQLMATILGASRTLEHSAGRLSEQATADLLRRLAFSAHKLDRRLTDLIDLERLGWGAISLNRRPFDIAALLDRVTARWRRQTLWPEVHADPATMWLDPDKVERIADELLANAARHTPPDTPVWVRAHCHGTGLRLTVEDAGPGVPSELRSVVFEHFRHGYTVRTPASGLGIGLSLVMRLAELHGGTAWVEERSGGGASFQVILPGPAH